MKYDGVRFELTIAPEYVASWGFKEAIREFIQNGIDAETENPQHTFEMDWDSETEELLLKNKNTSIEIKSMLLGRTTKANNKNLIGQFGEGYKIATLVMNRLGKKVTIHNGETGQLWQSSIEHSERFDSDVLVFTITESEDVSRDLNIRISNVTYDETDSIEEVWLNAFDEYRDRDIIKTKYGDILLDEDLAGCIYVNGLFVQKESTYKYGYNIKPQYIELDRDRGTVMWYDLRMTSARMITEAAFNDKISADEFIQIMKENNDIEFAQYVTTSNVTTLKDKIVAAFDKEYPNSIPVRSQREFELVKSLGGRPVIIAERLADYVDTIINERIDKLAEERIEDGETMYDKFNMWFHTYCNGISDEGKTKFNKLIEKLAV